MKTYQVMIFAQVSGEWYNNRTSYFWRLPDALDYATERERRGERWEVKNRLTGETYTSED